MLGVEGLEPWTGKDSLEAFARTEISKCCKEQWGKAGELYSQSYTNTASHGPHRPSKNLCSSSAEQCLCNSSSFWLKSDDI